MKKALIVEDEKHIVELLSIHLKDLINIIKIRELNFVNLQYGDTYHEQAMVKNLGLEMISFNQFDFSKDIDAWISLSNACDGIVSISSSIVHFAGAIGKKVSVVVLVMCGCMMKKFLVSRKII